MAIDWMIWGGLLLLGGGGGYVLGSRKEQVGGFDHEERPSESEQKLSEAQQNWKEFCGCLAPMLPVYVGQFESSDTRNRTSFRWSDSTVSKNLSTSSGISV